MASVRYDRPPVRSQDDIAREVVDICRRRYASRHKADKAARMVLAGVQVETSGPSDTGEWPCWANKVDPDTMKFPHDGYAEDKNSSGYLQQRPPWWGGWGLEGARRRMTLRDSVTMFLDELDRQAYDFAEDSKRPGLMVQDVQDSAHPNRYDDWGWPVAERVFGRVTGGELLIPDLEGIYR